MNTNFTILLVLLTFFGPVGAIADRGGWVSSGGEIYRFSRNPWFVKNTKTVQYCLAIDQPTVSATTETVRRVVRASLDYWKKEFNAHKLPLAPGMVEVADQDFVEVSHCEGADLAVKVGYGSLNEEEIDYLTKPEFTGGPRKKVETYIGVSIRKNYDQVNLKGHGTLFIASDLGPHAYENKGQLITQAWKNERLLQYAVTHELGHLFGIPHTGVGVMSETFLDLMLSMRMSSFYANQPFMPFLSSVRDFEVCSFSGTFQPKFFQITEPTACLLMKFDSPEGSSLPRWQVFRKEFKDSTPILVGQVSLESSTAKTNGAKPMVILQLPDEQKVFSMKDKGFASFLVGGILQESDYHGAFKTKSSMKPYPVFATMTPDSVTFLAVVDGKLESVLVYTPPSLLRMLVPIP